jgi:drug/metabolite transporter (DMT)-like permease
MRLDPRGWQRTAGLILAGIGLGMLMGSVRALHPLGAGLLAAAVGLVVWGAVAERRAYP